MPTYRGLIVPEARFIAANVASEANGSDFLEVGPRPGVPVDQNTVRSRMTLQASGTIAATGDVTVTMVDTGFPGAGARYKWRSETAGTTYGYDEPVCITGYEWVNFVTDAATDFRTKHPHALRLQSGDVLIACRISGTTATGASTEYATGIYKLTVTTGAIAYVSRAFSSTDDQTGAQMRSPCLLQLPSGRILCFDWDVSSTSPGAQVMIAYSDDDGATWADYSRRALDAPIDDSNYDVSVYSRLRAAYSNGQILLMAQIYDAGAYYLAQWASDDLGTTFRTVDANLGAGFCPNVVPRVGGGFTVMYIVTTTTTCKAIGSAFESVYEQGASVTITTDSLIDDLCMWEGEDGAVWAAGTSSTETGNPLWSMVSRDGGDTWLNIGSITSATGEEPALINDIDAGIWMGREASIALVNYSMAEYRGRVIMVTEVSATETHNDYSLLALYLGGHSNINLPRSPRSAYGRNNDSIGWRATYVAVDNPADFAVWTSTNTGTPTCDLDASGWDIQLDATENQYYALDPTYIVDADISDNTYMFFVGMTPNTGGSAASDEIALRVRLADGTDDYDFALRLATTGFALYDHNAAGNAFAPVVASINSTQFLIYFNGSSGVIRVYYRTVSQAGLPLRTWTTAGSGTLTNDTATPNAAGILRFGSIDVASGATRSHWRVVAYTAVPKSYGHDPSLASSVGARHLSTTPATLGNGTKIAGVDGPAVVGEAWNILPEFDYPVENMFPQLRPSPRQTFRSEQQNPTMVAVALDGDVTRLDSTSIGLSLRNTNVRAFTVQAYNGAWNTIATVTNGWSSLKFSRLGDVVVVNTGATTADGNPWFPYEGLAGGYVQLNDGLGAVTYHRIVHSTEGRWSAETGRRVVLQLHPDDMAGAGSSGDAWIVPQNVTVLMHDVSTSYSRWRLNIADATYPDADGADVRIGACIFGPIVYFGRQYGENRAIELQPNVDVQTRRSGTRTSRVLGPPRKRISFSWLDGIDQTELAAATTTSPTYLLGTTYAGQPVAAPADTALLVSGVLERLQGAHLPCVYLPFIPQETGNSGTVVTRTLCHPGESEYVRVVSTVRRETFLGDEQASELVRVAEVVLETEV
jgi:hypothetical protein